MSANFINYGPEVLSTTAGVTFGYKPGQQTPVRELNVSAGAGTTVVLPPILPTFPSPPGTPGMLPGSGDGLVITIRNATTNAVTMSPTSGDTLADATTLTGTAGLVATFICSVSDQKWYKLAN
jgi:hypothetical protein